MVDARVDGMPLLLPILVRESSGFFPCYSPAAPNQGGLLWLPRTAGAETGRGFLDGLASSSFRGAAEPFST
jgi:hypothetical protein